MPSGDEGLVGPRLRLEPLRATDAHRALYAAVYGSRDVMHLVAQAVPRGRMAESFAWSVEASRSTPGLPSRWCLVGRRSGRGIGLAGATHDGASGHVELGVLLLPHVRRVGYAREALSVLIDAFSGCAGVTRFWGRHHPENAAMARVFEGLGFTRSGLSGGLCVWLAAAQADGR